jgi:2-amino-4-hydroxy-6-hydroxymethyldihydropteridine diphosphokinase
MDMHRVIIALASNHHRHQHLQQARQALRQVLSHEAYTPVVGTPDAAATKPVAGTKSYLNQLVVAFTTLSVDELCQQLKQIEVSLGRTSEMRQRGIVPIDLDLLRYDQERHHLPDWHRPYTKQLLTLPTSSEL